MPLLVLGPLAVAPVMRSYSTPIRSARVGDCYRTEYSRGYVLDIEDDLAF